MGEEKKISSEDFVRGLIYALRVNDVESFDNDRYAVNYALGFVEKKAGEFGISLERGLRDRGLSRVGHSCLILSDREDWNKDYLIISEEKSRDFFRRQLPGHNLEQFRELAREFVSGLEEYEEEFGHFALK